MKMKIQYFSHSRFTMAILLILLSISSSARAQDTPCGQSYYAKGLVAVYTYKTLDDTTYNVNRVVVDSIDKDGDRHLRFVRDGDTTSGWVRLSPDGRIARRNSFGEYKVWCGLCDSVGTRYQTSEKLYYTYMGVQPRMVLGRLRLTHVFNQYYNFTPADSSAAELQKLVYICDSLGVVEEYDAHHGTRLYFTPAVEYEDTLIGHLAVSVDETPNKPVYTTGTIRVGTRCTVKMTSGEGRYDVIIYDLEGKEVFSDAVTYSPGTSVLLDVPGRLYGPLVVTIANAQREIVGISKCLF